MTKTQKRNARKRRAAGRIAHYDIELSLVRDERDCGGPNPGHIGGWFHSCVDYEFNSDSLKDAQTRVLGCCGTCRKWETAPSVETSAHLDTISTNASGPEDGLLDRLRRAYENASKHLVAGNRADFEVSVEEIQGSETQERSKRWPVGTDVETVVADVIAAVWG